MSAPYNLTEELYRLISEMTVLNGYNFDWEEAREWDNGGAIIKQSPILTIITGKEDNDPTRNGTGNQYQQLNIPIEIKFGKTLANPSDDFLKTTQQLNELATLMNNDVTKMFASSFRINMANVPEYCGSTYTGEGTLTVEEENLGVGTQIGSMEFEIIYKRSYS